MRPVNFGAIFLMFVVVAAVSYCGRRSKTETKTTLKTDPKAAVKDVVVGDSVLQKKNAKAQSLSREESDFILKAADARMMGILEGKAALKKGSTQRIRAYGNLMVKDQGIMLSALKQLSQSLAIDLPDTISKDKQDGLKDLLKLESNKFDRKFVRMMKIDHRRDTRLFADAKEFKNTKIKEYATRYLPLVESHLEKVKVVRKKESRVVKPRV